MWSFALRAMYCMYSFHSGSFCSEVDQQQILSRYTGIDLHLFIQSVCVYTYVSM